MSEAKELIFAEEAREKLASGIDLLTQIIKHTLGPKGRSVAIDKSSFPSLVYDGSSIVDHVEVEDQYQSMGIALASEVAKNIKEKCGDGTCTAILILNAIVKEGVKHVASNHSPIHIKRGMEKIEKHIIEQIEKEAVHIKSVDKTRSIATASASGDIDVGKMICEAFQQVGKDGVISIEEGKGRDTFIEIVKGMQMDRGYLSPYFCTDAEKMIAKMENPYVLITNKKINTIQEILPLLQSLSATQKELLIIADEIDKDALSTLVINRLRGTLKVAAIKAPGFGDHRADLLQDIAILTGAVCYMEEMGNDLTKADIDGLGQLSKVVITKEKTTLIGGGGDKKKIQERILQIDKQIKNSTSSYDKEKLEKRKAHLSEGVALIHVGALNESEMKKKMQLFQNKI